VLAPGAFPQLAALRDLSRGAARAARVGAPDPAREFWADVAGLCAARGVRLEDVDGDVVRILPNPASATVPDTTPAAPALDSAEIHDSPLLAT
jgi:hypothetical protein